jgi:1-acyl-sn-glycerol-3-phosphate acyltransferase
MWLGRTITGYIVRRIFGYKCEKVKKPEIPTIIISNHNSNLDPAMVMSNLGGHSYFVASEHALRKGLGSKLLKYCFDTIPINKTQSDTHT